MKSQVLGQHPQLAGKEHQTNIEGDRQVLLSVWLSLHFFNLSLENGRLEILSGGTVDEGSVQMRRRV